MRAVAARRISTLASIALAIACKDATRPEAPLDVPPFVFTSDIEGPAAIFRYDGASITRLSAAGHDDREPHSAAGRIVFTSRRDGNAEIYVADLALGGQVRLTTTSATDDAPALDPTGTTIAFVSTRSGTPRVWLMDANGANPRALATGSASFVPEGRPAWSPDGTQIAFTSTRTNTSQVYVMPVAGGTPLQLTRTAAGAFFPTWSADGKKILYVVLAGDPSIHQVPVIGGDDVALALDAGGNSEPSCRAAVCLLVTGASNGPGDLAVMSANGHTKQAILVRAADDRHPAVLIP